MIVVEPAEVYTQRVAFPTSVNIPRPFAISLTAASGGRELNDPPRFADAWDEHILARVWSRTVPVRIVSIASQLRKCVRHRNKQHKEKLKREILLRIGGLIRAGSLLRVRRKYVVAGMR